MIGFANEEFYHARTYRADNQNTNVEYFAIGICRYKHEVTEGNLFHCPLYCRKKEKMDKLKFHKMLNKDDFQDNFDPPAISLFA